LEDSAELEARIEYINSKLKAARVRFGRWLAFCIVFSICVSVLAILTRSGTSVMFFVAAGFGWFFVWNRWKCRAFVSTLLSKPVPSDGDGRERWLQTIGDAVLHPPKWWKRSENFAGFIFVAFYAVFTYEVVNTSSLWMKLLLAVCWALLILNVVRQVQYTRVVSHHQDVSGQGV